MASEEIVFTDISTSLSHTLRGVALLLLTQPCLDDFTDKRRFFNIFRRSHIFFFLRERQQFLDTAATFLG